MDNLSIDFKKLLPFAVDAFTKVYGEEYRDIIFQRINKAVIIPYHDIEGLSDYISYIKRCKRREYAINFLDKIGVDVKKHIKDNYTQPLDDEIEKILDHYMDSSLLGFSKDSDYWVPLQAFKPNNDIDPKRLLKNKIKIINYLLDNSHEQITEENFDSFVGTEEYNEILKKINELNLVYEQLLLEYRKWEEQLQLYEEFVESENKRKSEILKKKKTTTFMDVYSRLPIPVINAISGKSLEEKSTAIFGSLDIGSKSIIESFSFNNMEKLKSKDVDLWDKYYIVWRQSYYLKNIGVEIPNEQMLECDSEEDVNNYLIFLSQYNIRKYIPSDDLISYITSLRENNYEDALREYYVTRDDFLDAKGKFGNNEGNHKYIYEQIKNKRVCIAGQGGTRSDNEFISIMFYAIRTYDGGSLFYTFMHECGHIIDQSSKGTGFESSNDFNENSEKNPYDNAFRKYEKFNETLNDIFTMEAVELLHNHGTYLIEPSEFTLSDISNHNTALITKNLLRPLLSKFRQQVISAKVKADHSELIRYIGKDNFEELVDVVNKVDYLSRNGVVPKIDTSPEDEMVKEYFEQVERAKKIYSNIDNFYSNNVENLITTPNSEIRKSR